MVELRPLRGWRRLGCASADRWILLILLLVTASDRQVVMAYTVGRRLYIVARENFGPRVAQRSRRRRS